MENKKITNRLKIIEGQVRGISDMVQKNVYCIDIITQTSAIKRALGSLEDLLMERHLNDCLIKQVKKGKEKNATAEILKVYKLKMK